MHALTAEVLQPLVIFQNVEERHFSLY